MFHAKHTGREKKSKMEQKKRDKKACQGCISSAGIHGNGVHTGVYFNASRIPVGEIVYYIEFNQKSIFNKKRKDLFG